MAVFVSIFADLFADLAQMFTRMWQKVKEQSPPNEPRFLPIFLPIAQARVEGQVRGVHPRAKTLREVAARSDSLGDFGRHLRDWLHELRRVSTRRQAEAVIAEEPPRLGEKFPLGHIADAWLAAYAEHLAGKIGAAAPEWAFAPWRTSDDPIFDAGSTPALRTLALIRSPLAFKRRNIFTPSVDLPLALRAGRPAKSVEEKRKTNAERQRRFRAARREELATLRKLARRNAEQEP